MGTLGRSGGKDSEHIADAIRPTVDPQFRTEAAAPVRVLHEEDLPRLRLRCTIRYETGSGEERPAMDTLHPTKNYTVRQVRGNTVYVQQRVKLQSLVQRLSFQGFRRHMVS